MNDAVLVLGATGYLGRHLVTALADDGYQVRAVVRSRQRAEAPGPSGAPSLAGKVDEWAVGQVTDDAFTSGLCDGVDRVVSALGVTRQKADPWNVDFLSNLRVLEDAERHEVRSFLYVNVMHSLRERSMILRSKTAFAAALQRSVVAAQIVNPSGYFSDVCEYLTMANRGMALLPPNPAVKVAPIHGADLADFCLSKVNDGQPGSWDVGGPEVFTHHGIAELAFETLGQSPRTVPVPNQVVTSGVWLASHLGQRPRDLAQFFADGLAHDAIGQRFGNHRLGEYFQQINPRKRER